MTKIQKQNPILRLPPQNIEAEQCVLGSLLLDKDAIIKVADQLSSADFYRDDHGVIYDAVLGLFEKRKPIDLITLTDALRSAGKLKEVGGASYLTTLVNIVPTSAHLEHYAEIVLQKSTLRRLIGAASEISRMGYEEDEDIEKVLDRAERDLFAVSQKFSRPQFVPIKEALAETFDRIDRLHREKGTLRGVPTGFVELDNMLAGLQKSDLIIIAARPSIGKSTFALNIAENAAVEHKKAVGIFSLEMSEDQVIDRLLCSVGGLDAWKLRTGNLNEDDFSKVNYAMGVLSEAPIYIDDTPLASVMQVRAKARRLQSECELGLIVVDYLQLMEGAKTSDNNRVQEISDISRSLKALARELNIPVIAISQLSRAVESRPDKRPILSDLRESGSIEQDADVVMFLYRDDYYHKDSEKKNIAEILIRKHRNGPIGEVDLYFNPAQMRFRSIEKHRGANK